MQEADTRWIDEFAIYLAAQVEDRAIPPPAVPVLLPDEDAPDSEAEDLGYAEGQFFMIEYRDARGRVSSRRITVIAIKQGVGGVPMLAGHCHERQAYRQFRVDRIHACIDLDGVIHEDVPTFLTETFGMPAGAAGRREGAGAEVAWTKIRPTIKPYAVLLAALSHSDGLMTQDEVFVAAEHCAAVAEEAGYEIDRVVAEKIEGYLKRQRPNADTINDACVEIFRDGNRMMTAFLRAALAVVDADGDRHPKEVDLLNAISREMVGADIL